MSREESDILGSSGSESVNKTVIKRENVPEEEPIRLLAQPCLK